MSGKPLLTHPFKLKQTADLCVRSGEVMVFLTSVLFRAHGERGEKRGTAHIDHYTANLHFVQTGDFLCKRGFLCKACVEMNAERLRHLSPMDWEHISLTGDYP